MITTKIGVSLFAGGLFTAGLAYVLTRLRSGRPDSTGAASPELTVSPELAPGLREESYKARPLEVSALVGAHGLAPDRELMGEALADPDVVEVPVGLSADRAYDVQLQHDKLPQPDTTGAILKTPSELTDEVLIESDAFEIPLEAEFDDTLQDFDGGVSARPTEHLHDSGTPSEGYDALNPDDLGAEFLSRATQTPRADAEPSDPWDFAGATEESPVSEQRR